MKKYEKEYLLEKSRILNIIQVLTKRQEREKIMRNIPVGHEVVNDHRVIFKD